jgi:hypothetical protein
LEIGLDHAPDQLVVDPAVFMGEFTAKADDLRSALDLAE